MKYKIELVKGAIKDLKKLQPPVRDFIYNRFYEIAENPYKNEKLKGNFKELRSCHCKYASVDYRIIYNVNEEGKLIIIALVGTRENLYKELGRRI